MGCNTSPVTGEFSCDSTPVSFPPSNTPAATADHSAFDWATVISGTLGLIGSSIQAGSQKPTANLGIPGAKTPTPPTPNSKTAGYLITAAIIIIVILAFRRVARR